MEVEAEPKREQEARVRGEGDVLQLSQSEERDLTAGVKIAAEGADREKSEALSRLENQLEGARENAEREVAWIRRLVPGTAAAETQHDALPNDEFSVPVLGHDHDAVDGTDPRLLPLLEDDEVAVEYLLPSGDTFWQTHGIPGEYWDGDAEFARLIEATGTPTGELDQLLGSRVPISRGRSDWRLDLDAALDEDEEQDEEEETAVDIAESLDEGAAATLATVVIGAMIGGLGMTLTNVYSPFQLMVVLLLVALVFTMWVGVRAHELMGELKE